MIVKWPVIVRWLVVALVPVRNRTTDTKRQSGGPPGAPPTEFKVQWMDSGPSHSTYPPSPAADAVFS